MADEQFDTYVPPRFEPSGLIKSAKEAIADKDWLATINVWLYVRDPEPSMIYQLRDYNSVWLPGKLDVAAGGYYTAGESGLDGLRELNEELGIEIPHEDIHFFGRILNVGIDQKGRERRWVITIYVAEFKGRIEDLHLQKQELEGAFRVPLKGLLAVMRGETKSVEAVGITPDGNATSMVVTADSIPYNFDEYHQKMAEYLALKTGVDSAYIGD